MFFDAAPSVRTDDAPFVSIVMPAYRVECYIEGAIRCIQAQTFSDWELIVVDDGSPDKSGAIARNYAQTDHRIVVLEHDQNLGLSAARNTGLSHARGCYVWFPDPDDIYDTDLLEQTTDALSPSLFDVVVFGHVERYFNANGSLLYEHPIAPPAMKCSEQNAVREQVLPLERATMLGYAWNKLYRTDLIREYGLFFIDNLPLIEDLAFNVEFFDHAQSAVFLSSTPYHYAKRLAGNLTNKFEPRYYELHRTRIELVLNQQKRWGICTPSALATIGSLYGRYVLSSLERNCDIRSKMNGKARRRWCQRLFSDELFEELIPYARAVESKSLAIGLAVLRTRSALLCTALGRVIHIARFYGGSAFSKAKSKR